MGNKDLSNPTLINCLFSENSASGGGGMPEPTGGGVYNAGSSPTVTNCPFINNSANYGGGMGNTYNSSPTVTNCTFSGNNADDGGGIFCLGSSPVVTNTILWNNAAQYQGKEICVWKYVNNPSHLTISFSNVEGGPSSVHVGPDCALNWGPGMIDADPLFLDSTNGNLHITDPSPCIDAGDNNAPFLPTTDFEGDPRKMGPISFPPSSRVMGNASGFGFCTAVPEPVVDMGADEYRVP